MRRWSSGTAWAAFAGQRAADQGAVHLAAAHTVPQRCSGKMPGLSTSRSVPCAHLRRRLHVEACGLLRHDRGRLRGMPPPGRGARLQPPPRSRHAAKAQSSGCSSSIKSTRQWMQQQQCSGSVAGAGGEGRTPPLGGARARARARAGPGAGPPPCCASIVLLAVSRGAAGTTGALAGWQG